MLATSRQINLHLNTFQVSQKKGPTQNPDSFEPKRHSNNPGLQSPEDETNQKQLKWTTDWPAA